MTFEKHFVFRRFLFTMALLVPSAASATAQIGPRFKVIAIAEAGGIHKPFVDAAKAWLQKEAQADNFSVDYIEDTKSIDARLLAQYSLFIQLNYPPYNWAAAFTEAVEQGTIG